MLDNRPAGSAQTRIDIAQFILAFDLDAEMIEARLFAAGRNREIHARVVQHPFRIVSLDNGGLRGEERRIKADRLLEVSDDDVHMHAFHDATPFKQEP